MIGQKSHNYSCNIIYKNTFMLQENAKHNDLGVKKEPTRQDKSANGRVRVGLGSITMLL